ncbi:MAG: hypothetical protein E7199_07170 [Schwartzia succinivorans]|nr:hypothetical protein [Schwartzia succinivorans]
MRNQLEVQSVEEILYSFELEMNNRDMSTECIEDICSIDFIKATFVEKILNDLRFLVSIQKCREFKIRYENILLRSIVEQIIKFAYMVKHPDIISDFVGMKIDTDSQGFECTDDEQPSQILYKLKQLGQLRGKMIDVSAMAIKIGEKDSDHREDRLSLYDIYGLLSDEMHNSYYKSILDDAEELDDPEEYKKYGDTFQCLLLRMMLDAFWSYFQ